MKIFQMNDCDWVAAETIEEAKKCLAEMFSSGNVTPEFEHDYCEEPYEMSDEQMERTTFLDAEPGSDESKDPKNKRTFKEELKRRIDNDEKFPQFFASSEY